MKFFLPCLIVLFTMNDASAFFGKKKKEEKLRQEAEKSQICTRNALEYTYRGIQAKYSHWEYELKGFKSNFSYLDPNDGVLVVHVKEDNYRFEHKVFLNNDTCEVIGHESFAF